MLYVAGENGQPARLRGRGDDDIGKAGILAGGSRGVVFAMAIVSFEVVLP
jgi:hypothetical protein